MTALRIRKINDREPADRTTDILAIMPGVHNDVPSFISFQYWVATAGGASAGAYSMSIAYVDPTGQEIVIPGGPISLQDAAGIYSSPVQIMERQSETSLFEIREDLNGSADGALISYRIVMTDPNGENVYPFDGEP